MEQREEDRWRIDIRQVEYRGPGLGMSLIQGKYGTGSWWTRAIDMFEDTITAALLSAISSYCVGKEEHLF